MAKRKVITPLTEFAWDFDVSTFMHEIMPDERIWQNPKMTLLPTVAFQTDYDYDMTGKVIGKMVYNWDVALLCWQLEHNVANAFAASTDRWFCFGCNVWQGSHFVPCWFNTKENILYIQDSYAGWLSEELAILETGEHAAGFKKIKVKGTNQQKEKNTCGVFTGKALVQLMEFGEIRDNTITQQDVNRMNAIIARRNGGNRLAKVDKAAEEAKKRIKEQKEGERKWREANQPKVTTTVTTAVKPVIKHNTSIPNVPMPPLEPIVISNDEYEDLVKAQLKEDAAYKRKLEQQIKDDEELAIQLQLQYNEPSDPDELPEPTQAVPISKPHIKKAKTKPKSPPDQGGFH